MCPYERGSLSSLKEVGRGGREGVGWGGRMVREGEYRSGEGIVGNYPILAPPPPPTLPGTRENVHYTVGVLLLYSARSLSFQVKGACNISVTPQ